MEVNGHMLEALPTRDAFLPMIGALLAAIKTNVSVSALFAALPQRFTSAGLLNNFPIDISKKIVATFSEDTPKVREQLATYFTVERGFGAIDGINMLDGVRIFFDNGDIAHIRPSGNAPQLRIYSVADNQARADEIVAMALEEKDGIFREIQINLS
jgi:phosphomannomutase